VSAAESQFLLDLERQALEYFLDNQTSTGLMLDRQRNHGLRSHDGLCSTAATGMGFIGLALASAPPFRLISHAEAVQRIATGIEHALERLPQDHGIMPHFIDSATGHVRGRDYFSTIDSAWLIAGALWSAEFLEDAGITAAARRLYERVDWQHWQVTEGLISHGKDRHGRFLGYAYDRLNGETVFMYVLASGSDEHRALPSVPHAAWQHFRGHVAGYHFHHADLGLFVFQYGLDLLDLTERSSPMNVDMHAEAGIAAHANRLACQHQAERFHTYRHFWGLSAGDGPDAAGSHDYRVYAPGGPIDGTAHITATVASVAHLPHEVLGNLHEADRLHLRGRYGFSSVNLDCDWRARDMVGIDAGAAVLALDNFLMENRVRRVFHRLPFVETGLTRLGFHSMPVEVNRAS
jgi:hypothetical protein